MSARLGGPIAVNLQTIDKPVDFFAAQVVRAFRLTEILFDEEPDFVDSFAKATLFDTDFTSEQLSRMSRRI